MLGDSPPEAARGVRQRFPEIYQDLLGVAAKMLGPSPPRTVTPSTLTHDAFVKLSSEEARRRAQDLPDWFEMYNRLEQGAVEKARG